jgi:hypothetical protein
LERPEYDPWLVLTDRDAAGERVGQPRWRKYSRRRHAKGRLFAVTRGSGCRSRPYPISSCAETRQVAKVSITRVLDVDKAKRIHSRSNRYAGEPFPCV